MNAISQNPILVIEDQEDIRELIRLQLELQELKVVTAQNIKEAKAQLEDHKFDLLLIDRMLPDGSGIELCKEIRQTQTTPIIFITALSEAENIIEGLDAGADDYITKPFDLNILQARVRANLRRNKKAQENNTLKLHNLSLDIKKNEVKVSGEIVNLTQTEFQILKLLMLEPGIVHARAHLIKKILGDEVFVTNRIIDTHIVGLRKKIKDQAIYIETIRGVGYRFKESN